MNIQALVAAAGLCLVIIGHLVATVWWMSKIQTTLSLLGATVENIGRTLAKHEATYYSKEDVLREINRLDSQMTAMWRKVDNIKKGV